MTSANSVDGLAMMTSAVTSSESAVGSRHSANKRWSQQEATVHQQMVHSFKCFSVAALQTTKEVLVIKRDFRISAEDESSRSDEPAAKQLTIYEELSKLDVNC
ncbi:hypothetical protein F511_11226 [Dorcoceras hygrometricum]|uniref:Uncharacterized protein n=1 Tax=Dorcoceras hygrometricum TaxID=472368 RepID=A0A2Z7DKG1_9LAMI|nr:hypothetical protein F511_11226 [Dorcoceras hygrometricum]